ncbi:MAG TPA: ABC transporter substrate-binding protein [Thermoanaerobaculia bacterium]|nr:ABC transporter substrate-binding protein [Thermoanaerobaculia bacterium]
MLFVLAVPSVPFLLSPSSPGEGGGEGAGEEGRGDEGLGWGRVALLFAFVLFLPALLQAAPPTAPADAKKQLERGRQVYLEGTSPAGHEIVAVMSDSSVEVPASTVPCGGCHGRDGKGKPEGGLIPSDLTWPALTKPYGVTHPGGRKHPPYDVKLLKRAISLGIDPAGNKLNTAMPRFRMSLEDMEDLVAYLQQLGTGSDPGVSDTAVRVGIVLPPAGPLSGMGRAVRAALTARFDTVNREGGIYGRRIEPRFLEAPASADQRRAWTSDFLEREEVFAGVAPFFAGADAGMASLFQERQVPAVGPFTLHPQDAFPQNRYVFYLVPGVEVQAQALVRFAAAKGWPAPVTLRPGKDISEELKRLAVAKADPVLFLGSGPEAASLLQEADQLGWHPRFLFTGATGDDALFAAPAAFEGKIFLALPTSPAGPEGAAVAAYRSLGPLPAEAFSAQWTALAAADVLVEALRRAGRELNREKLVDQLETLNAFTTGYAPPVTFGPARRLGARGAYVLRIDLAAKRFVVENGWIEVESGSPQPAQ